MTTKLFVKKSNLLLIICFFLLSLVTADQIIALTTDDEADQYAYYKNTEPLPKRVAKEDDFVNLKVFVGILTSYQEQFSQRREAIRRTWLKEAQSMLPNLRYKFFMTRSTGPYSDYFIKYYVQPEYDGYNDIEYVESQGIDDKGYTAYKTLDAMRWAAEKLAGQGYDYFVKTDDDSYLHPYHLQRALYSLPRTGVYWGRMIPQLREGCAYFSGAGYVLSFDVLQAVVSRLPALDVWLHTHEDLVSAQLVNMTTGITVLPGTQTYRQRASQYEIYDYGLHSWYKLRNMDYENAGSFPPETVVAHQLKSGELHELVHKHFQDSLTRWSGCMASRFAGEACAALLSGGPVTERRYQRHRKAGGHEHS